MNIKQIFAISFFLIILGGIFSCKNVKKFKEDRVALNEEKVNRKSDRKKSKEDKKKGLEPVSIEETGSLETVVDSVPELFEKELADSLYMSYERTACFGRCPIYKIRIFDSGYATYEGINFVEMMGMYHSRIDEKQLISIEKQLNDMYFFQLEDSYDNENIQDLPAKIVVVNKPQSKKRIKARYQVPQELVDLFDAMDALIDKQVWKPGN